MSQTDDYEETDDDIARDIKRRPKRPLTYRRKAWLLAHPDYFDLLDEPTYNSF